jgi:hypothetical protein
MPDKKREAEFTVTDRRKFTQEGDLRPEASNQPQEEAQPSPSAPADTKAPPAAADPSAPAAQSPGGKPIPPPPTAAEQQAQKEAFQASSKKLDAHLQDELGGGGRVQDFEMSFERFVASLYMTALMQLGLMREQGIPPQVDLLGARQTIDTLGIISDKTKGNLTLAEENLMQNCLYELRVAYVEVTNALAQPPPPGATPGATRK